MSSLDRVQENHHHSPAPMIGQPAENRLQSIRLLTIIVGTLAVVASVGLFVLYISLKNWQILVLTGLYGLTTTYCFLAIGRLYTHKTVDAALGGASALLSLCIMATAGFLNGLGIPAAIVYLIYSLILSSSAADDRRANTAIISGIVVTMLSTVISAYSPLLLTIDLVAIVTPAIIGVLFMVYITLLANQFVTANLRIRLVTAFMAVVIIPMVLLSFIQSRFMFNVLNREVSQGLVLASKQAAFGLDKFLTDTQTSVQEAARLTVFSRYLALPADKRAGSAEESEMRVTLRVLDTTETNSNIYLSSYALLDENGINLFDTLRDRIENRLTPEVLQNMSVDNDALLSGQGADESQQDYFLEPSRAGVAYASPLQVISRTRGFFYVSAPIKDRQNHVLGVLRARFDGLLLQDLIKQYNGLLTDRSFAILVDENNIRLADAFSPNQLYKSIAPLPPERVKILKENHRLPDLPDNMLSTNLTEFDQLVNAYEKQPVFTTTYSLVYSDTKHSEIGAVSGMRAMPWRVIYIRADYSDEAIRAEQRRLTTLITTLLAGFAGLIAVGASQLLSAPIIRLTATAQRISRGDLDAQAPASSTDEFGMLGAAFNLMTRELRTLISQLEERVKVRTQEIENQNQALANRARQLQTVSDVARQIVSAQDLELLLSSITRLVSERFGFYHVGIFLLEETGQFAVLRAANSEGGQRMLARHHMLQVGKVGIVGYATGMGVARIATDVGEDAVFFNNPDLPTTRSEMALPLKVGGQVIGALDIQSEESNAFHPDDIELFTTLADQVAIAIYNNQLYSATAKALEEAQNLHRQYLRSEWIEDTSRRKVLGYLYNQAGIVPQQVENPLWRKVFSSGEPVYAMLPASDGSPDKAVMAVPVSVRGETIGVIHVQDQGDDRMWSEDEIAVVNSIANQVAVALENARLFENTVRRAEREKKVLQITARIRSTNDPEEMMRIAVSELQQALHASRAQIYIRDDASDTASDTGGPSPENSNSKNDNGRAG